MVFSGLDLQAIRRHFTAAAPFYAEAAHIPHEVNQRLMAHLQGLSIEPAVILDVGCGTGAAQPLLRARFPQAHRYALDFVLPLLEQARERLPLIARVRGQKPVSLVCADMHHLPFPEASVDLLWSCLSLQWATDIAQVSSELARVLKPGGLLISATLGPQTFEEIRLAFDGLDTYQHTSAFLAPSDWASVLLSNGFEAPVIDCDQICVRYQHLADLFREIRHTGANNASQNRQRGLMGKKRWAKMCARYAEMKVDDRYPLSYEVLYTHAWRGERPSTKNQGLPVRPLVFHPRTLPSDMSDCD